MYNILSNLINKKFYATPEIAQGKVDVVWGMNKVTDDQYSTLTMLVSEKYPDSHTVTSNNQA